MLILIAFLLSNFTASAAEYDTKFDVTANDIKKMTLPLTAKNHSQIRTFCEKSSIEAFFSSINISSYKTRSLLGDSEDLREKALSLAATRDSWQSSLLPFEETRMIAFHGAEAKNIAIIRQELAKEIKPLTRTNIQRINSNINWVTKESQPQKEVASSLTLANRTAVCALLTFTSALDCQNGILRASQILDQRGGFSLLELSREIFTDSRYQRGLKIMALKIIGHVDSNEAVQSHYFNELLQSFRESGLDSKTAEDFTWNIIAVTAASGPNAAIRVNQYDHSNENPITKYSLMAIAQSLPILDHRTYHTGHPYSFPEVVTTHCDNAKPYHFWMNAFLVHRLIKKEGIGSKGATTAIFSVSKGYQFISRSAGRVPGRAFVLPVFFGGHNIMRADMVYASAGVRFGAKGTDAGHLDIDEGFVKAIQGAQEIPTFWSVEKAESYIAKNMIAAYQQWALLFTPDEIYHLYNK